MIKRIYIKKILVSSVALFAFFLIYFIPNDKKMDLTIKQEVKYVNSDITTHNIYLLDKDNYVAKTEIVINDNEIENVAKYLLTALIIDGEYEDKIPNGFRALIPSDTNILDIEYKDNLVKVNFSDSLLDTEMEEQVIEAIIYTLTSINGVDKVIILIDGKILTKLPKSNINLPSTLDRSFGINKEYDVNKNKNISKTTIYYVNKYNDLEYYVPVTKVNNDTREKAEIIIEELSLNKTYNTSLMSYLNTNTKVMSVNMNNDTNNMIIDFNNYIYSDSDTNEISEEVINSICLSIKDNYDIKSIVFTVNNKEIYKTT